MKRLSFSPPTAAALRSCLAIVLGAAGLLGACSDGIPKVKPGSPALKRFVLVGPDGMEKGDALDPDGGVPPAIAPRTTFRAEFDRLLDGDKIETIADGGTVPKSDVVSASYGAKTLPIVVSYNAAGALLSMSPDPTLPSGSMVTLTLQRTKITGQAGEPFAGLDTFAFTTEPLATVIDVPPADDGGAPTVEATFEVAIHVNNLFDMTTLGSITVTAGGADAGAVVMPDAMDATLVKVSPPAGGWRPGTEHTVTVGKDLADVLGMKLGADQTATFTTAGDADGGAAD